MKHERIDRADIFGSVPKEVHDRLQTTLAGIQEEENVRKIRYQPVLVILIILLLCGAAVAAVTWDVKSALTWKDDTGTEIYNEALIQHAQPVNRVYEGDLIRVEVVDAIYDSRSLVVAWTVTNKSKEDTLYLLAAQPEDSIAWDGGAGSLGGSDVFVRPGGTIRGMMDRRIYDGTAEGDVHVGIRYIALKATADIVFLNHPEVSKMVDGVLVHADDLTEQMLAYEKAINEAHDAGKMVVEYFGEESDELLTLHGSFWDPSYYEYFEQVDPEEVKGLPYSQVDAMVHTGKFETGETLDIAFDLQVTNQVKSLLPDGKPVEKVYDDYTMRVTVAEVTPNTMEIVAETIFDDEATGRAYTEIHGRSRGMGIYGFDENGEYTLISNGAQGTMGDLEEREDGKWVRSYYISHVEVMRMPTEITICPVYYSTDKEVAMPWEMEWTVEEGITLPIA